MCLHISFYLLLYFVIQLCIFLKYTNLQAAGSFIHSITGTPPLTLYCFCNFYFHSLFEHGYKRTLLTFEVGQIMASDCLNLLVLFPSSL